MTRKPLFFASIALGLLALAGCSEVKLALHLVKKLSLETQETQPLPAAAEDDGYKLGTPYEIEHVWYFPSYDSNYNRTGIASWYGHPFHGRPTANGERYDMNEVTAAHPTLPLPSRVRVTNLENGRQVVMRVNDRGPFIDGRLIDVSRRAAQLLGFYRKGLAEVRVEYLGLDHVQPDVPWPADSPKIALADGASAVAVKPRQPEPSTATVVLPPVKPVRTAAARPTRVEARGTSGGGRSPRAPGRSCGPRGARRRRPSGRHRGHAWLCRGRGGTARRAYGLCGPHRPGRLERRGGHHSRPAQSRRAHGVADHRGGVPLKTP